MKAIITTLALVLFSNTVLAMSPLLPAKAQAAGQATVEVDSSDLLSIEITGAAAELLYFSIDIAPYESFGPNGDEPAQIKDSGNTSCTRSMVKGQVGAVQYRCVIYPETK